MVASASAVDQFDIVLAVAVIRYNRILQRDHRHFRLDMIKGAVQSLGGTAMKVRIEYCVP